VLQHSQPYSLIIIVLFMSSYALVDGIYLLARGLLLRLKPEVFIASEGKTGSAPDLLADLPPTTRRAVVFVRYAGAYGLGHVGWAFEWNNGWFNVGSRVPLREATPSGQTPNYLIRDNDKKFGRIFVRVAATSGIKVLRTPYRTRPRERCL
jgi:hypothetical protein